MERLLLLGLLGVIAVLGGAAWWAYHRSQQVPAAYEKILAADPYRQEAASTEMFNRSQRLAQQTKKPGEWKALFAADEINGYLAVDPERILARLLPRQVSDPRVVIEERTITMFCRYDDGAVSSVLSMVIEPFVASQRDVLGIRLRDIKAGDLSLPTGRVKEIVSQAAHRAELPLRWVDEEGDPVALVSIPPTRGGRHLELETLEVTSGEIRLAGRTKRTSGG